MIPRRIWVNLGAFLLLFLVLSAWAVRNVITLDLIERPYTVSAEFESSPGLRPNVEVVYLGVRVGTIDSVDLVGSTVRVAMDIERDAQLPVGITAAVRRKSAVGEPYVALEPPDGYRGGGPYIGRDDDYVVDQAMTSVPLAYGELFAAVDDLVAAVPGEDLGTVVHELAVALEGRAPAIRQLLGASEDVTTALASRADVLDALADELTALTHTIATNRETIGESFDEVAAVADTLAASADDIETLLAAAPAFGADIEALLRDSVDELGCAFTDVGEFVASVGTDAHISDLLRLLAVAGAARDSLDLALVETGEDGADGPYLSGSFGITVDAPAPPPYDPRPELPAPLPLLECTGGAPDDATAGDSDVASGESDGATGVGTAEVAERPARTPASDPASSAAPGGSEEFPLREVMAAFGAALVLILVVVTKPWRLLAALRKDGEG